MRLPALILMCLLATACGDDGTAASDDADATTLQDTAADIAVQADGDSADAEETDIEMRFPGFECDNDEQCSTGLCWGLATNQGAFQAPQCQLECVKANDFGKFCDTDNDCCEGHCCLGCGPKEGICVRE